MAITETDRISTTTTNKVQHVNGPMYPDYVACTHVGVESRYSNNKWEFYWCHSKILRHDFYNANL